MGVWQNPRVASWLFSSLKHEISSPGHPSHIFLGHMRTSSIRILPTTLAAFEPASPQAGRLQEQRAWTLAIQEPAEPAAWVVCKGSAHSRPTDCRISKLSAPLRTIKQDLKFSRSLQFVKLVNSGNELSGSELSPDLQCMGTVVPNLTIPEILNSSSLKLAQLI